jgi:hypothetical protein
MNLLHTYRRCIKHWKALALLAALTLMKSWVGYASRTFKSKKVSTELKTETSTTLTHNTKVNRYGTAQERGHQHYQQTA